MLNRLAVLAQYALPKQALTTLAGRLAAAQAGRWTTAAIRHFVARYQVDMTEAAQPDIARYACFNDFFTRALRPEVRPLAQAAVICPVDGAISQLGAIAHDQIFQAKGHHYSTTALLGGDSTAAKLFENGSFATIYLSPRDYHRVHMPCTGRLAHMTHVPGTLFSVNPVTARGVPGLFARNERVVCLFDTVLGPMALVLVGATIVGSMAVVWQGQVNPPRTGTLRRWNYADQEIVLQQGEEMGRFQLGSTIVVLFAQNAMQWVPHWALAQSVRLGEAMGVAAPCPAVNQTTD